MGKQKSKLRRRARDARAARRTSPASSSPPSLKKGGRSKDSRDSGGPQQQPQQQPQQRQQQPQQQQPPPVVADDKQRVVVRYKKDGYNTRSLKYVCPPDMMVGSLLYAIRQSVDLTPKTALFAMQDTRMLAGIQLLRTLEKDEKGHVCLDVRHENAFG